MITVDEIIDGILDREKEGKPPYLALNDAGGRTSWGISEKYHPEAWKDGPPSKATARVIYSTQYVKPFDGLIGVADGLRVCCIDDGVISGVTTAIKRLQYVLGVPLDGIIGTKVTLPAIEAWPENVLLKKYVVERVIRITRLVQQRPSDLTNLTGWVTRILSFLP